MTNKEKQEIVNTIPFDSCCSYSFISSIFSVCKFNFLDEKIELELDELLHKKLKSIVKAIYPNLTITCFENSVVLEGYDLTQMLLDAGLIKNNKSKTIETNGINQELLSSDCCKKTFLKTLYVLIGKFYYNKNNFENSNGYSIEFVFKNYALADDTKALMKFLNIKVGLTKRNNNLIMYIKNSEAIYNFFVMLDAVETAMEIQNNLVIREIRNDANRQGNCFDANLNKTLNASREQVKAINYILQNYGIDYLDESLKEVALLRLANEDITLNEMQSLYSTKISRAGLKYKLDKIISIYKNLVG